MKICSGVGWEKEDLERKQQQAKLVRYNHNSAHQHYSFSWSIGLSGLSALAWVLYGCTQIWSFHFSS